MIAGMLLHELFERYTSAAILREQNVVPKALYSTVVRSYNRLVTLVSDGKAAEAEAHWRRPLLITSAALLKDYERTEVRRIMYRAVIGVASSTQETLGSPPSNRWPRTPTSRAAPFTTPSPH